MKKTYFNPTLKVTQVEMCNMVCQSQRGMLDITNNPTETFKSGDDFGAKERDEDYESTTWSEGGLW